MNELNGKAYDWTGKCMCEAYSTYQLLYMCRYIHYMLLYIHTLHVVIAIHKVCEVIQEPFHPLHMNTTNSAPPPNLYTLQVPPSLAS